jgi:hypothetical protein
MPEISAEELEQFNKFKAMGTPDEVENALNERNTLARQTLVSQVAQVSGFEPVVLDKLVDGLELKVEGDKAFVGDKPIDEYANENWSAFLPALKAANSGGSTKQQTVPFVRQPVKAVEQTAASAVAKENVDYIKRTYGPPTGQVH